jgi:hypothetical protein
MGDLITSFFNGLKSIFFSVCEFFLYLPVKLINAIIALWGWFKEETLKALGNLLWDSFSKLSSLSPWEYQVDQQYLESLYVNINLFIPLDDLCTIGIFLLETWLMVRVAKYSVLLALIFFRPKKPVFKTDGFDPQSS